MEVGGPRKRNEEGSGDVEGKEGRRNGTVELLCLGVGMRNDSVAGCCALQKVFC